MLDLAGLDQSLDRPRHVLDRHVGVDAVLVEEVDDLDAEALERPFHRLADLFGPAVHSRHLAVDDVEAELGGDHHPVADRPQRLADDLLVGEGAVDFRRVEEGDAALRRVADQLDRLGLARARGRS